MDLKLIWGQNRTVPVDVLIKLVWRRLPSPRPAWTRRSAGAWVMESGHVSSCGGEGRPWFEEGSGVLYVWSSRGVGDRLPRVCLFFVQGPVQDTRVGMKEFSPAG